MVQRKFLRNLRSLPLALIPFLLLPCRYAAAAAPIIGNWLTQDHQGVIGISPCGAGFCGRILGMSPPVTPAGGPPLDNTGKPKCGLTILRVAPSTDPNQWNGHITDPDDGKVYDSQLSVDPQGRLHLRGYILTPLLGQTQIWTKYPGRLTADCRMG
jgi:uncharacterized protein (DUF2147 family)